MTNSALISLDSEKWDHKPSNVLQYKQAVDKYGNIKTESRVLGTRLGTEVADVTPKQLLKALITGQTWSPYVFSKCPDWKRRRRIENLFSSCQVLAVDFDSGITLEQIMQEASNWGVKFNIIHHSFSSTTEHPKFRGIVFLDNAVTDLEKAKIFSTGLTYCMGGDKVCVDLARIYYGSTEQSVVWFDEGAITTHGTLQSMADAVGAANLLSIRPPSQKDHELEWGTLEDQRRMWAKLTPGKRDYVKRKILGILREIEAFDGSCGGSRYECLWKKTSRIARMPEAVGNVIYDWVMERVGNNSYFMGWDKDASDVVKNAIAWSHDHCEPPV